MRRLQAVIARWHSVARAAEVQVKASGLTQVINYDYIGDGVTDSTVNVVGAAALVAADFIK